MGSLGEPTSSQPDRSHENASTVQNCWSSSSSLSCVMNTPSVKFHFG